VIAGFAPGDEAQRQAAERRRAREGGPPEAADRLVIQFWKRALKCGFSTPRSGRCTRSGLGKLRRSRRPDRDNRTSLRARNPRERATSSSLRISQAVARLDCREVGCSLEGARMWSHPNGH
jgi:hypothetical protein